MRGAALLTGFHAGTRVMGIPSITPEIGLSRPYGRTIPVIGVCLSGAHFRFATFIVLSIRW
jgi:hypothetical protein